MLAVLLQLLKHVMMAWKLLDFGAPPADRSQSPCCSRIVLRNNLIQLSPVYYLKSRVACQLHHCFQLRGYCKICKAR